MTKELEPFKVAVVPEDYDGPPVKSREFSRQLEDYVAPPFEDGADYAESEIEDHGEATVLFFDENDQVTVDPAHAAVEAKRFLPHDIR